MGEIKDGVWCGILRTEIRLKFARDRGHSLDHVNYTVTNPDSRSAQYITEYIVWLEDHIITQAPETIKT